MFAAGSGAREPSPQGLEKHLVHLNFHRTHVIIGH